MHSTVTEIDGCRWVTGNTNPLEIDQRLHQAIVGNELKVYYQPQIDCQTQRIVGVEALVRWQHPSKGLMLPGLFINLAEQTGLIVDIDEWVLRQACQQAQRWHDSGYPIFVAVNWSGKHFNQTDLGDRVARILAETQFDPRYLELELTESAVVKNAEAAIATMSKLKALGVQLSLDDFGSGYSSLIYLHQFPFDKLKIDRHFIHRLPSDSKSVAIVRTILILASTLNLKAIAEGVETPQQQAFLCENQCSLIQGYCFSPPVTAAQLEQMLLAQST